MTGVALRATPATPGRLELFKQSQVATEDVPVVDRAPANIQDAPPAANPTGSHWHLVRLLMLVAALGHFNRVGMSVAGAERIIPQYHFEPAQMGLVYSAFLFCYTVAMLPGGWFIDRFGARAALAVFGFGSAIF